MELREEYSGIFQLLDKLRADLAMAEIEVKQDMERLRLDNDESAVKRRWTRFVRETEPLRNEIDGITRRIAEIEAMKPPKPIIVRP